MLGVVLFSLLAYGVVVVRKRPGLLIAHSNWATSTLRNQATNSWHAVEVAWILPVVSSALAQSPRSNHLSHRQLLGVEEHRGECQKKKKTQQQQTTVVVVAALCCCCCCCYCVVCNTLLIMVVWHYYCYCSGAVVNVVQYMIWDVIKWEQLMMWTTIVYCCFLFNLNWWLLLYYSQWEY